MTLVLIDLAETLRPAGPPQTLQFLLVVEHSSRLRAASARNVMLVIDSIHMRPLDQTALLLDRCTCAVVLLDKLATPCRTPVTGRYRASLTYRQVLQADGLRITLFWWIQVGKVVGLVLVEGGKLPRPCGLTSPNMTMNFVVVPKMSPLQPSKGRLKPNRGWLPCRNTCQAWRQRRSALTSTLEAVF